MQVQDERRKKDSETADSLLVQQALAGDEDAFATLVYRYKALLYKAVCRYVHEDDEAHDVLQQVWLKLYLSLSTLRPVQQIGPWLMTVARHYSIDALRRRHHVPFSRLEVANETDEVSLLESIMDTGPMPEELAEHHELQLCLQRAIEALPFKYRPVVTLRYKNQLGFAEIGQVLNRPAPTVKAQFSRAKPFLRATLTEQLSTHYLEGGLKRGKMLL